MLKLGNKIVSLILTVALTFTFSAPALASGTASLVARFVVGQGSYTVYRDGSVTGAVYDMDAAPYIEDGRTLAPVRYLGDALGAKTDWDESTRKVTVAKDKTTILLTIGSTALAVNGKSTQMDVVPVIRDGRTYLPARWVAESLGAKVDWDQASQTVTITLGDAEAPPIVQPVVQTALTIPAGATLDNLPVWSDADLDALGLKSIPFVSQWLGPDHPDWGIIYPVDVMGYTVGSRQVTLWNYRVLSDAPPTSDIHCPWIEDKNNPENDILTATQYNKKWTETLETPPAYKAGDGNDAYDVMTVLEAFGVPKSAMLWDSKSQVLTVRAVQNPWGGGFCAPFARYMQIKVGDDRFRWVETDGTVYVGGHLADHLAPYMMNGRLVWEHAGFLNMVAELHSEHDTHSNSVNPETFYDNLEALVL